MKVGENEATADETIGLAVLERDLVEVDVRTEVNPSPPVAARDLFRAEGAWSIGREGGDYLLALDPGGAGSTPLASARFAPGMDAVTIFASESPLRHLVYPVDQILMMYALAHRGGVMLHAAGVGIEGRGYAFCGRSRAGKTTLSRQIAGAAEFVPLSDDRVVVRGVPGEHAVYGTPWPGEGQVAVNRAFPLAGLVFLARGPEHRLVRLSPGEALARILPVAAVPWFDPGPLAPILDYCGALVESVPCWELSFLPVPTVADYLRKHLS